MTSVDEAVERVRGYVEAQTLEGHAEGDDLQIDGVPSSDCLSFSPLTLGDLRALLSALELGSVADASREGSTEPATPSTETLLASIQTCLEAFDATGHCGESTSERISRERRQDCALHAMPGILRLARREIRALSASTTDSGAGPIAVTDELVAYISRFGGLCRDCADQDGVCPSSGLPCGGAGKAIRRVFDAYNYGVTHGFVPAPPTGEGGGL